MFKIPWADKRRFTGLEIEAGFVKLAQAIESAGSRKIVKLIVKKLASESEKDIVEALRNIVGELKGHLGHLTVCIPRHKVTVRFLRFPTVNEKEIEGMVRLQSTKELPFSKEEIISDYLITEGTKDGYAKVALVIVHQDVINGYLDILRKAGLEPERITFSTEAILDWYEVVLRQEKSKGCAILIDLDIDNADIVICYNSHLGFTRGLSLGTSQLREDSDLKNRLVEEIRRTIEGYTRLEKVKKVEKILLGQAGEARESLKTYLEQEFNLPCEMLVPLKNLTYQKEVSAVQCNLELSLLKVLGMVLAVKRRKLNLLPVNLQEKQKLKLGTKRVCTALVLLIGIISLGLGGFAKKIHDKQLRLFYLDREIKKTAPLALGIENMLKKIDLIETRRKIEGSSVDILHGLHNLVPEEISLSSFSYDEENKVVTLQGISTVMSEIFKFINTLEKSAYFKNVQLKYVSEKEAKAGGFTNFKIECSLEK